MKTLLLGVFLFTTVIVTLVHNTPVRMICGLVAVIAVLIGGIGAGHAGRYPVDDADE
jgi:hypothetical protein